MIVDRNLRSSDKAAAREQERHAYLVLARGVENRIAQLVQARGTAVSVEVDPCRTFCKVLSHQIQLKYGRFTRCVTVDHDTFMEDVLFPNAGAASD